MALLNFDQTSGTEKPTAFAPFFLIFVWRVSEVNFNEGDIIIPDTTLNYIIENYTDKEDGVRNLKRCIEIVYKKLNLYRLVKPGTTLFEKENTLVVEFPFTVTSDVINNLIKKDESSLNRAPSNMYL
jgi:ATP-dependent Lon protease